MSSKSLSADYMLRSPSVGCQHGVPELWNPYRNTHILAWQGVLASLLAMLLVVVVVTLVGGPEKGWQGTVPFPTLPLPVPGSQPDSRLSQPPSPAPLQASEGRSEPADASATGEPAAAAQAVAARTGSHVHIEAARRISRASSGHQCRRLAAGCR
jgi:hypothetical protein